MTKRKTPPARAISTETAVANAAAAVEYAQAVRRMHARKSPRLSRQRQIDLKLAISRLKESMRPIRRTLARLHIQPLPADHEAALREASEDLQRERRKLWKMNKPIRRKN